MADSNGGGLWAKHSASGLQYRLINQTHKCHAPLLLIFRTSPEVRTACSPAHDNNRTSMATL